MRFAGVFYSKTAGQMKRILLFLLITALTGCQKKDVNPALPAYEGLYKTWKLTQVSYNGKPIPPEQYITTVTFPRDGNFRGSYRFNPN